jgi:hypothetical protein
VRRADENRRVTADAPTCHVHGRAGIAHVCRHLRSSLARNISVPEWLSYPLPTTLRDYVVLRVCKPCADHRSLPIPPRLLVEGEYDLEMLGTTPVCEACFAAGSAAP